jgi:hypothetical protein
VDLNTSTELLSCELPIVAALSKEAPSAEALTVLPVGWNVLMKALHARIFFISGDTAIEPCGGAPAWLVADPDCV